LQRPSTTTAVMINRALDIAVTSSRCQLCPETAVNYVLKPDTAPATM